MSKCITRSLSSYLDVAERCGVGGPDVSVAAVSGSVGGDHHGSVVASDHAPGHSLSAPSNPVLDAVVAVH